MSAERFGEGGEDGGCGWGRGIPFLAIVVDEELKVSSLSKVVPMSARKGMSQH
jgi:hypothetical protein